eukprot:12891281-Prorocentrum_lima.AAC.1
MMTSSVEIAEPISIASSKPALLLALWSQKQQLQTASSLVELVAKANARYSCSSRCSTSSSEYLATDH